ncbi:MAG: large repetitive protein, partial [Gaiellales bacterium]|nr:large repetitive protein [Gaiellales bacterium]
MIVILVAAGALFGQAASAFAASPVFLDGVTAARTADPSNGHPGGVAKGAAIHGYSFLINADNTGDPNSPSAACHPATNSDPLLSSCGWTSIRSIPGSSPIIAQGSEQEFDANTPVNLEPGKYLLSLTADGYAIDGVHFTVPAGGGNVHVVAQMQPADLPLATLRVQVFNDTASTNGQWDEPGENPALNGGMAGFQAHLADVLGEVTTDWFGNALCTRYKQATWNGTTWVQTTRPDPFKGPYLPSADQLTVRTPSGSPQISVVGGRCLSNAAGEIEIGNLGPNRYAVTTVKPATGSWADAVRTTTLEGAHDWDTWLPAGSTGYDTEFLRSGEPTPWTEAGFVHAGTNRTNQTRYSGEIKGRVVAAEVAVPQVGGLPYNGSQYGQANGAKPVGPINKPWIVISDLNGNNDQVIAVQRGNADGTFDVKGLAPSDYSVTIFDDEQDYILDSWNITVGTSVAKPNGLTVDMGTPQLVGWFTDIHGTVFNDTNENGVQDPGETGVPGFLLALKTRNNSLMDQGSQTATTDLAGHYDFHEAYPLGLGTVLEAYTDRFYTTGLTYQATNQPDPTTLLGTGVDINFLPIIGLSGRADWGVKPYAAGTNGGIVGTVSYDSTRNELDPVEAAVEDYQPGIPDLKVNLYAPVPDGSGGYVRNDDGSYARGQLLNQYTTEQWQRMKNCLARNIDGLPITQGFMPSIPGDGSEVACIEAPASGLQFSGDDPLGTGNSNANLFSSVDGNYGFGDGCQTPGAPFDPATGTCTDNSDPTSLNTGDYLVKIEIPDNPVGGGPMYQVTKEEDVNVYNGDSYSPQVPPAPCAGALHTVDVAGVGQDGTYTNTFHGQPVPDVPVDNQGFVDAVNGSPYEGQARPLCDMRLVTVQDRKSVAPTFNLFTPVPIPGKYWGLINDDLNLQLDPTSMNYGEVAGIPHVPVTIYDFANRPIDTVHSDGNGFFEALEPSTSTYNCPLPAGPCPGVYRMVGNDPNGINPQTGAYVRNADHNAAFNTISANFQVWPGLMLPADLALSQSGVATQTPGSTTLKQVECKLPVSQPQLFAVDKPWGARTAAFTFHLTGVGFGSSPGTASMTLDGATTPTTLGTSGWGDRAITVTVPGGITPGIYQLSIKASNGLTAVNAITIHVTGTGSGRTYNPTILTVNRPASVPSTGTTGATFPTIQDALETAARSYRSGALVVVFPGALKQPIAHSGDNPNTPYAQLPADPYNLDGAYYENIVIHSPVKLQGVGPGGIYADGSSVPGTVIDGSAFQPDSNTGTYWSNLVAGLNVATNVGAPERYEGQTVYVVAPTRTTFTNASFKPAIDGVEVRGGATVNPGAPGAGGAPILSQGGGIFVDGYSDALRITNNLIDNNDGAYAGGIRVGTPEITQNHNYGLRIAYNRILSNGGANLAGGVGIFQGTNGYEVDHNDLCGNFSAEYGGAMSHYGLSGANGSAVDRIDHNRIYLNRSYDEGGGVTIAGELPANPDTLTQGSGAVDIFDNVVQSNLANDDGGGLRLLMVDGPGARTTAPNRINIYNNTLADNISTHEGGGIAMDDASNVTFDNNTVVRNITTATAATSNGQPAPAGLSTSVNSTLEQNRLAIGAPAISRPIMFNNIFWDNRAGSYTPAGIQGIGLAGDNGKVRLWDFGIFDQANQPTANKLHVTSTVYDSCATATNCTSLDSGSIDATSTGNTQTGAPLAGNPLNFVNPFSVGIVIMPWRNQPQFIGNFIVAADLPP